ncbi:hypothetical protein [Kaistia sp. MMO-174]|uniref:hypothetical protein n=1 Tax=Kaistia sp. MMO-174 TaxID=3081256 RepID=UPI0030170ED5
MLDIRTDNREYLLPNAANRMKSEDVPRLIASLQMIDADIAAIITGMVGFAPKDHQHAIADIIGLASALSGKADYIHTHSIGSLGGVDFSSAASGQFIKYNGNLWIPASIVAADISNATTIGRAILLAANAAVARDLVVPDGTLAFAKIAAAALAAAADIREANAGKLLTPDVVLAAMSWVPLDDAATIAINHAAGVNRAVTIAGNRLFGAPTNAKPGFPWNVRIKQDTTGSRIPTWSADFDFGDFGTPVLSTPAGAEDLLAFVCIASGKFAFMGMRRRVD